MSPSSTSEGGSLPPRPGTKGADPSKGGDAHPRAKERPTPLPTGRPHQDTTAKLLGAHPRKALAMHDICTRGEASYTARLLKTEQPPTGTSTLPPKLTKDGTPLRVTAPTASLPPNPEGFGFSPGPRATREEEEGERGHFYQRLQVGDGAHGRRRRQAGIASHGFLRSPLPTPTSRADKATVPGGRRRTDMRRG